MDYIELRTADDISRFKELVDSNAYQVLNIKITYNPDYFDLNDLEEHQSVIEKYFKGIPITFEESDSEDGILFTFGIN